MMSSKSTSITSRFFGLFKKQESQASITPTTTTPIELEVPCALPTPPPATYAAYHQPRTAMTVMDEFFGAGTPVMESTAPLYRPTSVASQLSTAPAPPPYAPYGHEVVETEPGVYAVQEPATLARSLFRYGFIFFPFWIVGIYVLLSPLRPTPDWESGKTAEEIAQSLKTLRATEKKWGFRCLYALLMLLLLVAFIVGIVRSTAMH